MKKKTLLILFCCLLAVAISVFIWYLRSHQTKAQTKDVASFKDKDFIDSKKISELDSIAVPDISKDTIGLEEVDKDSVIYSALFQKEINTMVRLEKEKNIDGLLRFFPEPYLAMGKEKLKRKLLESPSLFSKYKKILCGPVQKCRPVMDGDYAHNWVCIMPVRCYTDKNEMHQYYFGGQLTRNYTQAQFIDITGKPYQFITQLMPDLEVVIKN